MSLGVAIDALLEYNLHHIKNFHLKLHLVVQSDAALRHNQVLLFPHTGINKYNHYFNEIWFNISGGMFPCFTSNSTSHVTVMATLKLNMHPLH